MAKKKRVGQIFAPCSENQRKLLMDETTDIILTGGGAGGGKTRMCLTKYLGYLSDPNFRGVVLRQSIPQLSVSGGIIDESHQIYPYWGGIYKTQAKKWVFPSGATLQFAAIGDDRDLPGWQGSQLTNILIDEAAEWTEKQIIFLLSRIRSANFKGKMQMVLSANPSNVSYLYQWVLPLLDKKTGVPKEGTEDIVRWFVNVEEKIRWGDSPEELFKEWGRGKTLGKDFIPKSFRFVPLSIFQNKILLENNPDYLAGLLAQSKVNQLRFVHGSWTAIPDGGTYWKADWCKIIRPNEVPDDLTMVRGYDFAGSAPSAGLPNPDWTVGVKMGRSKSTGCYYVLDVNRFRKNTHEVLQEVIQTAEMDGIFVQVVIPRDTAAGGKFAYAFTVQRLAEAGIATRPDVQSGHANKLQKFQPFCSVSEAGLVYIVEAEWNDDYINELSMFAGGSRSLKDDQVDATSTCFKFLAKQSALPEFTLPSMTRESPLVN